MPDEVLLWIVGKVNPENPLEWELQGVFDTEEGAVAACTAYQDTNWFVGPVPLNVELLVGTIEWPEMYYPKGE